MSDALGHIVLISSLEKYAVCPRQCALIFIEGIWSDNAHTLTGTLLHQRADSAGFENHGETKTLRALPLHSQKYGLTGKADVVEMVDGLPVPVEYKKGRRKQWDNDDIQLCAQALCLEEMFDCPVPHGFIYHAASKRRREVTFDEKLRGKTASTIQAVRDLLEKKLTPPAVLKPCCDGCSLRKACMPEICGSSKVSGYENQLWVT